MNQADEILALINRANEAEVTIRLKFSSGIPAAAAQQIKDNLNVVVTNLEQLAGTPIA